MDIFVEPMENRIFWTQENQPNQIFVGNLTDGMLMETITARCFYLITKLGNLDILNNF